MVVYRGHCKKIGKCERTLIDAKDGGYLNMIQYCKRCCLPSTKPHLSFDEEGICNACRNYENRKNVDWDERKKELLDILDRYRSKDGSNWDCIIPVSGGKDSTYQVVTMLELGMNPLCVTATTCDLTEIGRKNIENIKKIILK